MTWWWAVLTTFLIGHFCVLVSLVNWAHGIGFMLRRHDEIVGSLLITIGLGSLVAFVILALMPWSEWPTLARVYLLLCLVIAIVGLPVATLTRWLRKMPPEVVAGPEEIRNLASEFDAAKLVGSVRERWIFQLPGNHSLMLRHAEWSLTCPSLPTTLDQLSITHLTDLHFSRVFDQRFFDAIAAAAMRSPSDLVLFTGDLLDDDVCLDWIEPVFGQIRGRLGNYAILGNHDLHHQPEVMMDLLRKAGFTVLNSSWERLSLPGATLALGGTWYPWGPLPDRDTMPASDFHILLSHSPDTIYEVARWGLDLVLSGHNHAGQVRIPALGPILMPSRYGRRLDHGFFRVDRTWLHVGAGIGAKHPYRYKCYPEITRLVLRSPLPA